ncbi:preprotein translocase subunit SecE [Petrocella sp. FN5]|uniref:preprotein translocase subunit SecE n=1 Tax=Petrocella sp. FN5 TaxID=3032002 RepID=UPI0023DAC944|nr:preprotein translocase subunit SecE [Petrocella sp. FN5]MDF1616001.1 preprotein translocase subunit SecE [Petrocella sp. FN5]
MGDSNTTRKTDFFKGLKSEFKKIVWPSFPVLMKQTGIVIAVSLVVGGIVAGIDTIFGAIVRFLLL